LQDQILFIIDFEFSSGIFGEQHLLTDFDAYRDEFAVIGVPPRSDGDDFTLHRPLFRGGIRQDDAAFGLFFPGFGLDDNPIA
jgi:hypothetical protein